MFIELKEKELRENSVMSMFKSLWKDNDNINTIKVKEKNSKFGIYHYSIKGINSEGQKVKKTFINVEIFNAYDNS